MILIKVPFGVGKSAKTFSRIRHEWSDIFVGAEGIAVGIGETLGGSKWDWSVEAVEMAVGKG